MTLAGLAFQLHEVMHFNLVAALRDAFELKQGMGDRLAANAQGIRNLLMRGFDTRRLPVFLSGQQPPRNAITVRMEMCTRRLQRHAVEDGTGGLHIHSGQPGTRIQRLLRASSAEVVVLNLLELFQADLIGKT